MKKLILFLLISAMLIPIVTASDNQLYVAQSGDAEFYISDIGGDEELQVFFVYGPTITPTEDVVPYIWDLMPETTRNLVFLVGIVITMIFLVKLLSIYKENTKTI